MACRKAVRVALEGTEGVPSKRGREQQLVWSCFDFNSLHVRTLTLTDVQTPFLGTPLVPLKVWFKALRKPCSFWLYAEHMLRMLLWYPLDSAIGTRFGWFYDLLNVQCRKGPFRFDSFRCRTFRFGSASRLRPVAESNDSVRFGRFGSVRFLIPPDNRQWNGSRDRPWRPPASRSR